MTEQSIADFLAELDAHAAEREEEARALLAPPEALSAIGRTAVAGVASGLRTGGVYRRRQAQNAATTRLTQPPASERARFCRHCGAALRSEARFCTKCGEPIDV